MKKVSLDGLKTKIYSGLVTPAQSAVTHRLIAKTQSDWTILIASSRKDYDTWADDLSFYNNLLGSNFDFYFLPELNLSETELSAQKLENYCDTLTVLSELSNNSTQAKKILFTTPDALLQKLPEPKDLQAKHLNLKVGQSLDFDELIKNLSSTLHYDNEALCEAPGQYAVRGGLVDIYPINASIPYRIDFFGDEVESIRSFDPTSQMSDTHADCVQITPALKESIGLSSYIWDYLPDEVNWVLHNPEELERNYLSLFEVPEKIKSNINSFQDLIDARSACNDTWLGIAQTYLSSHLFGDAENAISFNTQSMELVRPNVPSFVVGHERLEHELQARSVFFKQLLTWQKEGKCVYLLAHNDSEHQRIQELLKEDKSLKSFEPTLITGDITHGFLYEHPENEVIDWPGSFGEDFAIITSNEIFGRNKQRIAHTPKRKLLERASVDQLLNFSELIDGDHLVHLQHGICIFRGLTKMDLSNKQEEVISLEFSDHITLHVRLHDSHLLSRYVGLSKVGPKLGKVGSKQWDKTRKAAETATLDLAGQLLNLQAERTHTPGYAFGEDTDWQKEFESSFLYKETPDQLQAIEDSKLDMQTAKPMDRLICGDVGFGKTEVAIRAAFKAVMEGKQVALLIPTTVLCQQHFTTFKERMAEYPVVVEMLSRFRTSSQQRKILKDLKEGTIDIVVGTHSLISSKVEYANLGLLIIDEEHRFGVKQKEAIKNMRASVDVLSMSATPIPRSLHLALVGARDLSIIETPPRDRLPIITEIKSYDLDFIKKAIDYELKRGGQVFYLHNKVSSIHLRANEIQEMLPSARIAVGHGQMEEAELEQIMTDFVVGKYDVLVCTTIIESGLDIPNSNTIIIEGADKFGLSQLYQLRGRVGRFNRQAYAYLLVHTEEKVADEAKKRLGALKQYNQLGAGFRIAMRDLELRGAGNILGAQQSGHIAGVGFDLYCQLLRQSVARLKGDKGAQYIRAQVSLDFVIVGQYQGGRKGKVAANDYQAIKEQELKAFDCTCLEALIPNSYIEEPRLRIDFYRRLATLCEIQEIDTIASEMKDRFGAAPKEVESLLMMTHIRCMAEKNGIISVHSEGPKLKCQEMINNERTYITIDGQFPRLTQTDPTLRLVQIQQFIERKKT